MIKSQHVIWRQVLYSRIKLSTFGVRFCRQHHRNPSWKMFHFHVAEQHAGKGQPCGLGWRWILVLYFAVRNRCLYSSVLQCVPQLAFKATGWKSLSCPTGKFCELAFCLCHTSINVNFQTITWHIWSKYIRWRLTLCFVYIAMQPWFNKQAWHISYSHWSLRKWWLSAVLLLLERSWLVWFSPCMGGMSI